MPILISLVVLLVALIAAGCLKAWAMSRNPFDIEDRL